MNNDELKKKMVEIIIDAIWKDAEADYASTDESEARTIADVLIAAGIGDVETVQKIAASATTMAVLEAAKAVHRAEVAERALRDRATYCALEDIDYFSLTTVAIEARAKELYDGWVKQAEKELAEEGKDE